MKVVAILLLSLVSFSAVAAATKSTEKALLLKAFEEVEETKCTISEIHGDELSDYEVNCSSPKINTSYFFKIFEKDIIGAGYAWTSKSLQGAYCTVDGFVSAESQGVRVNIACDYIIE